MRRLTEPSSLFGGLRTPLHLAMSCMALVLPSGRRAVTSIGPTRTFRDVRLRTAIRGVADIERTRRFLLRDRESLTEASLLSRGLRA